MLAVMEMDGGSGVLSALVVEVWCEGGVVSGGGGGG